MKKELKNRKAILLYSRKITTDLKNVIVFDQEIEEIKEKLKLMKKQEFKYVINQLRYFEMNADLDEFKEIWGSKLGEHLWQKFRRYNNILLFFGVLDDDNRDILLDYLSG